MQREPAFTALKEKKTLLFAISDLRSFSQSPSRHSWGLKGRNHTVPTPLTGRQNIRDHCWSLAELYAVRPCGSKPQQTHNLNWSSCQQPSAPHCRPIAPGTGLTFGSIILFPYFGPSLETTTASYYWLVARGTRGDKFANGVVLSCQLVCLSRRLCP